MNLRKTERGFKILEFKDFYGSESSLQESSLATDDCIWLGLSKGDRMHLDREKVKKLLPYLNCFVETGELPEAAIGKE